MTTETLIVISPLGLGTIAILPGLIFVLFFKYYFSSYFTEKGKNLATSEDITAITEKIEGVRTQYATLIEELKARHQLRLAAVDRRLQAHQETFTLWRELLSGVHTGKVNEVVLKCQDWWEKNCIYLEPNVREAFVSAYHAASMHKSLMLSNAEAETLTENWSLITNFPNAVFKAVQLPALSELEVKALGVTDKSASLP